MNVTELNQSDYCLYFSCPERFISPAVYLLLYVFAVAAVLLTVCGNLFVIVSIFHFKQLHSPTNMLVLSLAITDFLLGASVLPPFFIWTIESCWMFGTGFCMYVNLVGIFLVCLSVYHMVLIAVDRYFALSNPFLYNSIMSLRKIQVVIFSQWCVWLSYSLTLQYVNGNFNDFTMCPGQCLVVVKDVLVIIDLVTTLIFPCTVIIILYTGVFVIAKKHVTAIREISNVTRSQSHTNSIRSERKAAKVLGILVAAFLACLLPYFFSSILANFIDIKLGDIHIVMTVFSLNSTINPVIYALFYPWFRRCVKTIVSLQILQTGSSLINVLS